VFQCSVEVMSATQMGEFFLYIAPVSQLGKR
jgi:hypothetical protein